MYNIIVGNEFVTLFEVECTLTNFETISPLEIGVKLKDAIAMILTGGFRETKQILKAIKENSKDAFLTDERIQRYIDMLDAADAKEYATSEDYYYQA